MAHQNALSRDHEVFFREKPATMDYLRHAAQKSGRSPMSMVLEYNKLRRGRGKMTLPEYVQYGLYDESLPDAEKGRFITNTLHWPVTHKCCDMTWQAATEDKWLCSHILAPTTVPVPETLAVIDRSDRAYPNTRRITTADELRDFALSRQGEPFFAKENRGIASFGAFCVLSADKDGLELKGEGRIDYESCMADFIGSTSYLLQPLQKNHAFFDRYTDNLATVRVCILITENGIKIPFAVLKLPTRENIADSFWRSGNLACDLDPASGTILKARTKNPLGTEDFDKHPATGDPLVEESLPDWDKLLDLVRLCAPVFAPVRYQSMDIAITENGPVLIEINTGGGFDLPQLASGRGFLTDEVSTFFRHCGYKDV